MIEGYVIDAIPKVGKVELVLNGFRHVEVPTTYPIYAEVEDPRYIAQHPSVVEYFLEEWKTLDHKTKYIYRFEVNDIHAYYYMLKKGVRVVNDFPSPLAQTLYRLKALPMHKVFVLGSSVVTLEDDELKFPEINYAKVSLYDWYGDHPKGKYYRLWVNGELKEEGEIRDLQVEADVVECMGIACKRAKASVLIDSMKKRSPVDVKGLIFWSRITKVPLREIRYSTIGKALTTNEAWVALRKRVIIPRVKVNVEKLRSLNEVQNADKGGLVLFPKPGCYDRAIQVDFSSMYPSIISKYNISGETIDVCDDIGTEIGHTVCMKERGIVSEAIEWLVKAKEELKRRGEEELADAVKWILVASFGYLGYRNSKFGKIEAYETVTYFARKILRRAIEVAGESDLKVIHGLIDSLIVQGGNVGEFVKKITEETGIRLKIEAEFDWVVFTPNRNSLSYPQRYFGRKKDGGIKVKGLIRSNMPVLVQKFLRDLLEEISEETTCEGVKERVNDILPSLLQKYIRLSFFGEPSDYVIWVKGEPYIRGVRGFYNATTGYSGHDPYYYLNYLKRLTRDVMGWFN